MEDTINCPHCSTPNFESDEGLAEGLHEVICKNCQQRFDFTVLRAEEITPLQIRLLTIAYRTLSMFTAELGRILEDNKAQREKEN